jgi:hypothetical protein
MRWVYHKLNLTSHATRTDKSEPLSSSFRDIARARVLTPTTKAEKNERVRLLTKSRTRRTDGSTELPFRANVAAASLFMCESRSHEERECRKKTSPALSQKLITQMETSLALRFYFIFHALLSVRGAQLVYFSCADPFYLINCCALRDISVGESVFGQLWVEREKRQPSHTDREGTSPAFTRAPQSVYLRLRLSNKRCWLTHCHGLQGPWRPTTNCVASGKSLLTRHRSI